MAHPTYSSGSERTVSNKQDGKVQMALLRVGKGL